MERIVLILMCLADGVLSADNHKFVLNDLGCWYTIGNGNNKLFKESGDEVQKCAQFAHMLRQKRFAVHGGGECITIWGNEYRDNGPSWDCKADGKGGDGVSQVYEINRVYQVNYRYVGCYADSDDRAIATLEGRFVSLHGDYATRSDAINKCARAAAALGYRVFAVQNGGWCAGSADADRTYDKYGPASACEDDGEGGPASNAVYEITCGKIVDLEDKGCYRDEEERAIPSLEGDGGYLDGSYDERENAVEKCVLQASSFKFKAFAVQNGGWCASSKTAHKTYDAYGPADDCASDGEGGIWANQVYRMTIRGIIYVHDRGCWMDDSRRTVKSAENATDYLSDSYGERSNAIEKCAYYARKKGYTHFVIQGGGWCGTAKDAGNTFARLGPSQSCNQDGKGGSWANQVYRIAGSDLPNSPLRRNAKILYPAF